MKDLCLQSQMDEFQEALEGFTFIPVVANPQEADKWDGEVGLVDRSGSASVSGHERP